jgi:Peptidase A4 family
VGARRKLLAAFLALSLGGLLTPMLREASSVGQLAIRGATGTASGRVVSERLLLVGSDNADSRSAYKTVLATNWAGFAQHTKTEGFFSAVRDTWKVPAVKTRKSGKQYASDWVGIGGYSNGNLVQAGTSEWNNGRSAQYNAWTEVLPESEVVLTGLRIHPGDVICTTVVESSPDEWLLTVDDVTTHRSQSRTVHYRADGMSAEAIHERPSIDGQTSTLATTGAVVFDPGSFSTARPGKPRWHPLLQFEPGAKLARIVMVNRKDTITFATPSAPSSDELGFCVADGSASPTPPN